MKRRVATQSCASPSGPPRARSLKGRSSSRRTGTGRRSRTSRGGRLPGRCDRERGVGRPPWRRDNLDPHDEKETQEKNRALSRQGEKATKKSPPRASLEAAMVVVSDRAKKATLVRLLGMEAMVVVMLQEHLAKIVRQKNHRGNRRRTPQDVVVRARQQGEGSPRSQPRKEPGQKGGSYRPEGELQPQGSCKERKRAWILGSREVGKQGE